MPDPASYEAVMLLERCILRTARDDISLDEFMKVPEFVEIVQHKMGGQEWVDAQSVVYACRSLGLMTAYGDIRKLIPIGSRA